MIRNYNQLTIGQFVKCKTIAQIESDPVQRKVKMLAAITGKSEDEIESLPFSDLLKQLKDLSEIEALQPNAKVKMRFKVKGQRFECIWRAQDLSAAQYIDANAFCSQDIITNIHNILAAICVRRTWFKRLKYRGEDHKEIATLFNNHMKISQAYPMILFFCKYCEVLERNILTCLEKEVQGIRQGLLQNGAGLQPSTTLRTTTGQSGITSLT